MDNGKVRGQLEDSVPRSERADHVARERHPCLHTLIGYERSNRLQDAVHRAHGTAEQEKHKKESHELVNAGHVPTSQAASRQGLPLLGLARAHEPHHAEEFPTKYGRGVTSHLNSRCRIVCPSWTGEPPSLCEHGTTVYPGLCFLDRSAGRVLATAGVKLLQHSLGRGA